MLPVPPLTSVPPGTLTTTGWPATALGAVTTWSVPPGDRIATAPASARNLMGSVRPSTRGMTSPLS